MTGIKTAYRYAAIAGVSVAVFASMQVLGGGRHCLDCGARVGFPFVYMQEGTFSTLGHFIWLGFFGDCTAALAIAVVVVWLWNCKSKEVSLAEIKDKVRQRRLLEFLVSKEPAWKDVDHPELAHGSAEWVRKIREESERASQKRCKGKG